MEAGPLPLPSAPWQVEQRVVKMLRAAGESVALTPTGAVSAGLAVGIRGLEHYVLGPFVRGWDC